MTSRIAVLASGSGTTVEAYIRASQNGAIDSNVALVIASREQAGVFDRIDSLNRQFGLNIETRLINHKTFPPKHNEKLEPGFQSASEEAAILEALEAGDFDLIALMGYMKRIGLNLIERYGWLNSYASVFQAKMVNTHPGLLPDTKGFYGQQIQNYVLDHHLPYAGQSLHAVSNEYDAGPIIAEHKVEVYQGDTPDSLFERVQAVEKKYLPKDIDDFIKARQAYSNNQPKSVR